MMKPYRFLLLDLDHTLLDFDSDMALAFQKLYHSQGFDRRIPYSPAMLDTYEKHNHLWWRRFEAGACTKPQLFRGRFQDFLEETGLSGDLDRMNDEYFQFLGQGGAPYPGAVQLLEKLRQRYSLSIITNGFADSARSRIKNAGFAPAVSGCFASEEVGFAKPDPRYFTYVANHIPGFRQDQALVIGDSLATDIQGANNAGLDSLWYHPRSAWEGPAQPPFTYEAKNYGEMEALLLG